MSNRWWMGGGPVLLGLLVWSAWPTSDPAVPPPPEVAREALRVSDSRDRRVLPVRQASADAQGSGDAETVAPGGLEGRVLSDEDAPMMVASVVVAQPAVGGGRADRRTDFVRLGEGRFSFAGLAPGQWRVWDFRDPGSAVVVEVESGAITDGVAVTSPDRWVQPTLGCAFAVHSEDGEQQLSITELTEGGPAARAGLQVGDRVVELVPRSSDGTDGKADTPPSAVEGLFMLTLTGADTAEVTVERGGSRHTLMVR